MGQQQDRPLLPAPMQSRAIRLPLARITRGRKQLDIPLPQSRQLSSLAPLSQPPRGAGGIRRVISYQLPYGFPEELLLA